MDGVRSFRGDEGMAAEVGEYAGTGQSRDGATALGDST